MGKVQKHLKTALTFIGLDFIGYFCYNSRVDGKLMKYIMSKIGVTI